MKKPKHRSRARQRSATHSARKSPGAVAAFEANIEAGLRRFKTSDARILFLQRELLKRSCPRERTHIETLLRDMKVEGARENLYKDMLDGRIPGFMGLLGHTR